MKIRLVNESRQKLPEYSTEKSAGIDLRANIENDIILKPLQRVLRPTGLFIEIPAGYEARKRPRGGLSINRGNGGFGHIGKK